MLMLCTESLNVQCVQFLALSVSKFHVREVRFRNTLLDKIIMLT